jgi:cupin 2 domain-containing protein
MDTERIQHSWISRGFSFGVWTDPPGQVWEDYIHDEDELFMVLEGKVELEMDGKSRILEPGEEILIPANTYHSVRNLGNTVSRWLYGYRKA